MRNDGTEVAELHESNVFEIQSLRAQLNIAKGGAIDAYNQTRESLRLLGECRDLFEVVMDTQLHEQIQALIKKIDTFKGDER